MPRSKVKRKNKHKYVNNSLQLQLHDFFELIVMQMRMKCIMQHEWDKKQNDENNNDDGNGRQGIFIN